MLYPPAELLDRISILKLKKKRGKFNCDQELKTFTSALNEYPAAKKRAAKWIRELYRVNGKIWTLEAAIRQGKEGQLGLEEVGRRALKIRDFNKERVAIKNKITAAVKIGFQEKKVDHASK